MSRKMKVPSSAGMVPDVLKSRRQWVTWMYKEKADGGQTKVPYLPNSLEMSSSTDADRWGSFEDAYQCARSYNNVGIGYVITADDPIVGIDLDDVIDDNGDMIPWVKDIVKNNETYTEISPSGNGLRIFSLAEDKSLSAEIEHNEGIEIYYSNRFLTITGDIVKGCPREIKSAPKTLEMIRERISNYKSLKSVTGKSENVSYSSSVQGKMPAAEINELLDYVPASSLHRMEWLRIVFAIHSETGGSSEGYNIADNWSSNDKRYRNGEIQKMWQKASVSRGVTIATLVGMAKSNGANVGEIARKHRPDEMSKSRWEIPASSNKWVSETFGEGEHKSSSVLDALPGIWMHQTEVNRKSDYLIKNFLGRGELAMLYGPSHTGKTYVAIDLAYNISSGTKVLNRRVRQSPVLYLSAEGGSSTINRLVAVRKKYEDDTDDSQLYFVYEAMNIYGNDEDIDKVRAAIDYSEKLLGKKFGLIIVDTLSRSTPGMDENSSSDTTKFIDMMDTLRKKSGATILLVHHTGKDASQGARGHSSLRGAVDTELMLYVDNKDPDNPVRKLKLAKSRNSNMTEAEFAFNLDSVELGEDDEGDEIISAVVEWIDEEKETSFNMSEAYGHLDPAVFESFKEMVNKARVDGSPYTMNANDKYIVRALANHMRDSGMGESSRKTIPDAKRHIQNWLDTDKLIKEGKELYFV